jgi:hypothetical protein
MANLVTVTQQLVPPSTGYRKGIPDESGTCHATGSNDPTRLDDLLDADIHIMQAPCVHNSRSCFDIEQK